METASPIDEIVSAEKYSLGQMFDANMQCRYAFGPNAVFDQVS